MALISDFVVAAGVTGSFAFASVVIPIYLRNRRSMRKVSAEEFIENFMKRQSEEIAHKDELLRDRETTIRNLELAVKKWTQKAYKYESIIKELKGLLKELRQENKLERQQNEKMKKELTGLKETYEQIYAKKFVDAVRREKE